MWTIEVTDSFGRCLPAFKCSGARKAMQEFKAHPTPCGYRKRLLLDGVGVRTHLGDVNSVGPPPGGLAEFCKSFGYHPLAA